MTELPRPKAGSGSRGPPPPAPLDQGAPLSAVRVLITVVIGATLIGLAMRVVGLALEVAAVAEEAPAEAAPVAVVDRSLRVRANEPVRTRVEVDGEEAWAGILRPGEPLELPTGARTVLEVSDLTRVEVLYNGRRVEPLGNVSSGRRLVFIDDGS